jgi:Aldehyde dehydrogenase family
MSASVPKFMIESIWRGRVFGAEWRDAAGGTFDVIEPGTGATITRVGNASAEDVRKAAAEARAAQPDWAATPYEKRAAILRTAARVLEDNQDELIPWIARETGGIPAKAGFEEKGRVPCIVSSLLGARTIRTYRFSPRPSRRMTSTSAPFWMAGAKAARLMSASARARVINIEPSWVSKGRTRTFPSAPASI